LKFVVLHGYIVAERYIRYDVGYTGVWLPLLRKTELVVYQRVLLCINRVWSLLAYKILPAGLLHLAPIR